MMTRNVNRTNRIDIIASDMAHPFERSRIELSNSCTVTSARGGQSEEENLALQMQLLSRSRRSHITNGKCRLQGSLRFASVRTGEYVRQQTKSEPMIWFAFHLN